MQRWGASSGTVLVLSFIKILHMIEKFIGLGEGSRCVDVLIPSACVTLLK